MYSANLALEAEQAYYTEDDLDRMHAEMAAYYDDVQQRRIAGAAALMHYVRRFSYEFWDVQDCTGTDPDGTDRIYEAIDCLPYAPSPTVVPDTITVEYQAQEGTATIAINRGIRSYRVHVGDVTRLLPDPWQETDLTRTYLIADLRHAASFINSLK